MNSYLLNFGHEKNIGKLWGRVKKTEKMFAIVVMGHNSKKKKGPWFNDQCNSSTEENYKASLNVIQNSIEENKEYCSVFREIRNPTVAQPLTDNLNFSVVQTRYASRCMH